MTLGRQETVESIGAYQKVLFHAVIAHVLQIAVADLSNIKRASGIHIGQVR